MKIILKIRKEFNDREQENNMKIQRITVSIPADLKVPPAKWKDDSIRKVKVLKHEEIPATVINDL
jgi:hypothetical protein